MVRNIDTDVKDYRITTHTLKIIFISQQAYIHDKIFSNH